MEKLFLLLQKFVKRVACVKQLKNYGVQPCGNVCFITLGKASNGMVARLSFANYPVNFEKMQI